MLRVHGIRSIFFVIVFSACSNTAGEKNILADIIPDPATKIPSHTNSDSIKTIHVFVALCDNKYQGIVPVPASIGNGQDAKNNLYWGAGYGIKAFFGKRSRDWELISTQANPVEHILERLLLKHRSKNIYLLADAYDGQYIRQTTIEFLFASSGNSQVEMEDKGEKIYFGGASNLIAYVGHDGLMDFSINQNFEGNSDRKRETIILACYSKRFFSPYLKQTGASPLVWSTGLMAPEAYILHDAINAWLEKRPASEIRLAAAKAYSKYQRCTFKAALGLLVSGW
ncbi:MAG: hypothetical protein ABI675_30385 [Chitinophagaceae bacterium]